MHIVLLVVLRNVAVDLHSREDIMHAIDLIPDFLRGMLTLFVAPSSLYFLVIWSQGVGNLNASWSVYDFFGLIALIRTAQG